jgi:hypothetical protein
LERKIESVTVVRTGTKATKAGLVPVEMPISLPRVRFLEEEDERGGGVEAQMNGRGDTSGAIAA